MNSAHHQDHNRRLGDANEQVTRARNDLLSTSVTRWTLSMKHEKQWRPLVAILLPRTSQFNWLPCCPLRCFVDKQIDAKRLFRFLTDQLIVCLMLTAPSIDLICIMRNMRTDWNKRRTKTFGTKTLLPVKTLVHMQSSAELTADFVGRWTTLPAGAVTSMAGFGETLAADHEIFTRH